MNVPAPPGVVPAPPEGGPANGAADAQIRLAERFRQPNEKVQRQLDALVSNLAAANPRFVWVTLTPEVSDDQVAETLRKNILASSTPRAPTSAAETGGTGQPNLRFNLPESTSATGQVLRVRGTLEQMEQVVKELRDASASVEWIVPASTVSAEPEQDRSRQSDAPANSEESSQRTVEYFHKLRNPADKPQSRSAPSDYFVVLLRAPTGVNAGGATASPIPPDAKPPAPSAPVPAKPAPPAPSPKPGDP